MECGVWSEECGVGSVEWGVGSVESRIQTYADGSLLIEGSHEAVKALVAHYQPRFTFEILR